MITYTDRLRDRLSRMLPDISPPLPESGPKIEGLLAGARAAFSQGFHEVLRAPLDAFPQLLCDEPFQTRGFALEGAAMAAVLLDELDRGPRRFIKALLAGRSYTERILCAIGVGWAGARLGRNIAWSPPELESAYKSAMADGYGFHQGFFHPNRFEGRGFPAKEGELSVSYDTGLGRALWFVHLGRIESIAGLIDGQPEERRRPLWRGVGTACAFTGSVEYAAEPLVAAAAACKSHVRAGIETGARLLNALAHSTKEVTQ